jgi:hypothetical protein
MDLTKQVTDFVALRDKIKALDTEHKNTMGPLREELDRQNEELLAQLNAVGAESVRTAAGTAYKLIKRSASIADAAAFWEYVRTNEEWDLLDRRVNLSAATEYVAEHNQPPPGVNYSSHYEVGVRRA